MMQLELPLSRSTDPMGSFEAADKLIQSGALSAQQNDVYTALHKYIKLHHVYPTSKALAWWSGYDRYMVARRLPDLVKHGLIEQIRPEKGECRWRIK